MKCKRLLNVTLILTSFVNNAKLSVCIINKSDYVCVVPASRHIIQRIKILLYSTKQPEASSRSLRLFIYLLLITHLILHSYNRT